MPPSSETIRWPRSIRSAPASPPWRTSVANTLSTKVTLARRNLSLLLLDPSSSLVIPGALDKAVLSDALVSQAPMVRHRTQFGNPRDKQIPQSPPHTWNTHRACGLGRAFFFPQAGLTFTDCEEVLPFWPV